MLLLPIDQYVPSTRRSRWQTSARSVSPPNGTKDTQILIRTPSVIFLYGGSTFFRRINTYYYTCLIRSCVRAAQRQRVAFRAQPKQRNGRPGCGFLPLLAGRSSTARGPALQACAHTRWLHTLTRPGPWTSRRHLPITQPHPLAATRRRTRRQQAEGPMRRYTYAYAESPGEPQPQCRWRRIRSDVHALHARGRLSKARGQLLRSSLTLHAHKCRISVSLLDLPPSFCRPDVRCHLSFASRRDVTSVVIGSSTMKIDDAAVAGIRTRDCQITRARC